MHADAANHEQASPMIHVVGVGLSGAASLSPTVLKWVESATLIVGAQRHLEAFEYLLKTPSAVLDPLSVGPTESRSVECWPLGNFTQVFADLRSHLSTNPDTQAVVLASGDPLFFGVGRLLLTFFPAEQLIFHPQVSAIQLAFSRLKQPWQDATLISVHGRGEQQLVQSLKRGDHKIAVLTDGALTPGAIANLVAALDLPIRYQLWVCENLGDGDERISRLEPLPVDKPQTFASLNVVVLLHQPDTDSHQRLQRANALPLIGLPDAAFKGFPDRPTLMTKREIRLLILGALAPLPRQTIWDIGAGTGSVSIELSRLCPTAHLYAIEKTAMGASLIRHNASQLAIAPIQVIQGQAPNALATLPTPDRVFIGGSSGQLKAILDFLHDHYTNGQQNSEQSSPNRLRKAPTDKLSTQHSRVVLALATVEHLSQVTAWVTQPNIAARWQYQLTQINISRSLPVGSLTRFSPLNPVTLVTLDFISHESPRQA